MKNFKLVFGMYRNLLIAIFLVLIIVMPISSFSQSGNWVWIKGDYVAYSPGSRSAFGVENPTNEPPARYEAAHWKDLDGNFWIFGGYYKLNDLWKYNPKTNNWTCVKGPPGGYLGYFGTKGVPSVLNNPPALGYGSITWVDYSGDLWLFSGADMSFSTISNDVIWRYHIATNEWTWIQGSVTNYTPNYGAKGVTSLSNTPGSRAECKSSWLFNNKLWFFGGAAYENKLKNDLWSFDLSSFNWTWESGTNKVNDSGSFGLKNIPDSINLPPARFSYTNWQDADSNFYLFGGGDIQKKCYNDVWKFEHKSKLWTWISGSSKPNDTNNTKTYCISDSLIGPAARFENGTVFTNSTCTKAFWTFGGGDTAISTMPRIVYNDLWIFNVENLEWTKIKGGNSTRSFGVKGKPDISNTPAGKLGSCIWTDNDGLLYVFGGYSFFEEGLTGSGALIRQTNDLWKFIPDTACIHTGLVRRAKIQAPKDTTICIGDSIKVLVPFEYSIITKPTVGTFYDTLSRTISFFDTNKYTIFAIPIDSNDQCLKKDSIVFSVKKFPKPKADFQTSPAYAYIDNPIFNLLNWSENSVNYEWYYDGVLISKDQDIVQSFPSIGKHCILLVAINQCNERDSMVKCVEVINRTILDQDNKVNRDIVLLNDGNPNSFDTLLIPLDTANVNTPQKVGIFIPNTFTPNGDSKNDKFKPIIIGKTLIYTLLIVNRWGQEIFITNNPTEGWDGRFNSQDQEVGVYYYLIKVKFDTPDAKEEMFKGDITLIR